MKNLPPQAIHQRPSFLEPSLDLLDPHARFASLVSDCTSGIGLCLELIYSSDFNRRAGQTLPLLDENDTERLTLFAIASARLLTERADVEIDALNDKARSKASD